MRGAHVCDAQPSQGPDTFHQLVPGRGILLGVSKLAQRTDPGLDGVAHGIVPGVNVTAWLAAGDMIAHATPGINVARARPLARQLADPRAAGRGTTAGAHQHGGAQELI